MPETRPLELKMMGADPKLPFYITGCLNLDGSVDISREGKDPLSLEAAIENAREMIGDHGDDAIFVIECRVVRKVTRGKIRVQAVTTKANR